MTEVTINPTIIKNILVVNFIIFLDFVTSQ